MNEDDIKTAEKKTFQKKRDISAKHTKNTSSKKTNASVDRNSVFLKNTEKTADKKPTGKKKTEASGNTRSTKTVKDPKNKTSGERKTPFKPRTQQNKSTKKNTKFSDNTKKTNTSNGKGRYPKKKTPRNFIVKVCTSKKSCGEGYGPFVWERICNEHNEEIEQDSFVKNGITYKKSPCQGLCKRSSNVQVEDPQKKKTTQFSYMTPLKSAKLISSIRSGAAPENIKRL